MKTTIQPEPIPLTDVELLERSGKDLGAAQLAYESADAEVIASRQKTEANATKRSALLANVPTGKATAAEIHQFDVDNASLSRGLQVAEEILGAAKQNLDRVRAEHDVIAARVHEAQRQMQRADLFVALSKKSIPEFKAKLLGLVVDLTAIMRQTEQLHALGAHDITEVVLGELQQLQAGTLMANHGAQRPVSNMGLMDYVISVRALEISGGK